jgi:hypothetical protein
MTLSPLFLLALVACDVDVTGPKMGPGPIDIDVDPQDHEASAQFSYDVPLAGQRSVRLKGVNGQIHFKGAVGLGAMEVLGKRQVGSESMDDAQAHLELLQVQVQEGLEEIFIETRQPRNDGRNYEVDYTITLPRDMKVYVESANGKVTLEGMAEDAHVDLVNGEIEASLTLPPEGIVDLFTVNGGIDLDLQRDASAQFKATLTHGKITTANLQVHDQVATAHSLTGRLGDGSGLIKLTLVNGDIRVEGR